MLQLQLDPRNISSKKLESKYVRSANFLISQFNTIVLRSSFSTSQNRIRQYKALLCLNAQLPMYIMTKKIVYSESIVV